jgi:poly(3-hydroxybutyrate) depolymerase
MIRAFVLALVACTAPVTSRGVVIDTMELDAQRIEVARFVPSPRTRPFAVLLVFHGAGGNGREMLEAWRGLAEAEGIVVIAPTLSLTAEQETHLPAMLPAILDQATHGLAVDPHRTFAFGYSAGGYFAFDAATLLADRFAGAAVFASRIAPEYAAIVEHVSRRPPIAIYIGDRDPWFSIDQVRATRDLLVAHGFPVHYVELTGSDHDYAVVAERVNRDAWAYLSATPSR